MFEFNNRSISIDEVEPWTVSKNSKQARCLMVLLKPMKTAIAMNRIGGKSNSKGEIKTFSKKLMGF
jgi:hypothetical protein